MTKESAENLSNIKMLTASLCHKTKIKTETKNFIKMRLTMVPRNSHCQSTKNCKIMEQEE
jgi:hypothetical protein